MEYMGHVAPDDLYLCFDGTGCSSIGQKKGG